MDTLQQRYNAAVFRALRDPEVLKGGKKGWKRFQTLAAEARAIRAQAEAR